MRYKTIYADPPWMEAGGGKIKRGADRHYPLMKTKDIINLPVADIADDNCHLYLWTTNNFLQDALKVMEAWGFKYKTKITWVKSIVEEDGRIKLPYRDWETDRKSTRLNSSHITRSRMPSSA